MGYYQAVKNRGQRWAKALEVRGLSLNLDCLKTNISCFSLFVKCVKHFFLVGKCSPFFLGIVGQIELHGSNFSMFTRESPPLRPGTDCEAGTAGTGRLWHPGEPVAGWVCGVLFHDGNQQIVRKKMG